MALKRRAVPTVLRGGAVVVIVAVLVVGALAVWHATRPGQPGAGAADREPLPHRVEVQVLNGGTVAGLALAMTRRIRAAGLDVVLIDDARDSLRDSTRNVPLVLVRRGDTTGVGRLRAMFDTVEVRDAPDPRPLVDLTVVFGGGRANREPRPGD